MRILLVAALALACNPSDDLGSFEGGDFDFQTIAVSDGCLDGGFELLFMPEGPTVPNPFGVAVYIPAVSELPLTYEQALPDPFPAIEVTVTGDEETRTVTGAEATGVEFDADNYPGCLVDSAVEVALTVDSLDEVHGTATLETGSFDEGSCPTPEADPCTLSVTIEGTRR